MGKCFECGKELKCWEGYRHPVLGMKETVCWNCFEKVMFLGSAKHQKALHRLEEDISRAAQYPEVASKKPRGNKRPAKGKTQKSKSGHPKKATGAGKKKRKDKDKASGPQLEIKFSDGDE